MASIFDNTPIQIPCPKCGHKTSMTIGQAKKNPEFVCQCGTTVVLESSGLRSGVSSADKALEDFKRSLKRFGK